MTLYRKSGLNTHLQNGLMLKGIHYHTFGDAAYQMRPWLQTAFTQIGETEALSAYNKAMSAVREAIEWTYNDLTKTWTSQDFKRI